MLVQHDLSPNVFDVDPDWRRVSGTPRQPVMYQMLFSVPFGRTAVMAPFWNEISTLGATSATMKSSVTLVTLPSMPPVITTSSPLARFASRFLCSLLRLDWGRM